MGTSLVHICQHLVAQCLTSLTVSVSCVRHLARLGPNMFHWTTQGDAVGAWLGDSLNVVVFPTAETLKRVQGVAQQRPGSLLLLVNPQWQAGQVVSGGFRLHLGFHCVDLRFK